MAAGSREERRRRGRGRVVSAKAMGDGSWRWGGERGERERVQKELQRGVQRARAG